MLRSWAWVSTKPRYTLRRRMADDSSKAARTATGAGGRRGSRLKVAGKLTALLGVPLSILFGIFASGVFCGATRADQVVELEQRWLGIQAPEGRLLGPPDQADQADQADQPDQAAAPDQAEPALEPEPDPKAEPEPKPEPKPGDDAGSTASPDASTRLPVAKPGPIGVELQGQFNKPRVARVKIMVDPALVAANEDWFTDVAALFEASRDSFESLFGIRLQLHAVAVWDAADGAKADALSSDLAAREHDGADLLLGLVARERPPGFAARSWTDEFNGDHALVFADSKQGDRHYRSMLRALAIVFGAEPTLDPAATQLGSFMTDAPLPSGTAPVIDPSNRGRVVFKKARRFAPVELREAQTRADGDDLDRGEADAGKTN